MMKRFYLLSQSLFVKVFPYHESLVDDPMIVHSIMEMLSYIKLLLLRENCFLLSIHKWMPVHKNGGKVNEFIFFGKIEFYMIGRKFS